MTAVRIGAIPSLNALPLTEPLRRVPPEVATITWGTPAQLAASLHSGELDLALIPQVELVADRGYRAVPGLSIACTGAVDSILLFSELPWEQIKTVAVDAASRSSVELLRVLFHLELGRIPEIVVAPASLTSVLYRVTGADAFLCIGDRALAQGRGPVPRTDLGERWFAQTQLPFVFALWVGRGDTPRDAIDLVLAAAREGSQRLAEIGHGFAAEHPDVIEPTEAVRYLTETLHHTFEGAEVASVERFARERRAIGAPIPDHWTPPMFSLAPGIIPAEASDDPGGARR